VEDVCIGESGCGGGIGCIGGKTMPGPIPTTNSITVYENQFQNGFLHINFILE
jgi:hypothetical protein